MNEASTSELIPKRFIAEVGVEMCVIILDELRFTNEFYIDAKGNAIVWINLLQTYER